MFAADVKVISNISFYFKILNRILRLEASAAKNLLTQNTFKQTNACITAITKMVYLCALNRKQINNLLRDTASYVITAIHVISSSVRKFDTFLLLDNILKFCAVSSRPN